MVREPSLRDTVIVGAIKAPQGQPSIEVRLVRRTKLFQATYMKRNFTAKSFEDLEASVGEHFSDEPIKWRPVITVNWTSSISEDVLDDEALPDEGPDGVKVRTSLSRSIGITLLRHQLGRREDKTYSVAWQWAERGSNQYRLATLHGQKAMEEKSRPTRVPIPSLPCYMLDTEVAGRHVVFLPYDQTLWERLCFSVSGADPLGATIGYLSTFKIPGLK